MFLCQPVKPEEDHDSLVLVRSITDQQVDTRYTRDRHVSCCGL